jgi:16S rRNA (uracil1498-N3)-methyltransferase
MQLFIGKQINNTQIELTEEESHHCFKVLRKKVNDELWVTDGEGNLFKGIITLANQKKITLEILANEIKPKSWEYYLHLAIAPTKNNDRIEWLAEKATELGINEISFIICSNSERRIIKTDRIKKITESASKQSLKFNFPKINDAVDLASFLKIHSSSPSDKFIADCRKENLPFLGKEITKNTNSIVLVGPEGDFSENEISQAQAFNFKEISLGKSRLRTETAGLSIVHFFSFLNNL